LEELICTCWPIIRKKHVRRACVCVCVCVFVCVMALECVSQSKLWL